MIRSACDVWKKSLQKAPSLSRQTGDDVCRFNFYELIAGVPLVTDFSLVFDLLRQVAAFVVAAAAILDARPLPGATTGVLPRRKGRPCAAGSQQEECEAEQAIQHDGGQGTASRGNTQWKFATARRFMRPHVLSSFRLSKCRPRVVADARWASKSEPLLFGCSRPAFGLVFVLRDCRDARSAPASGKWYIRPYPAFKPFAAGASPDLHGKKAGGYFFDTHKVRSCDVVFFF
jgi:hypothetical protein